ncbi:hypothetical protein F5882DRAFT_502855 [Hyaloscypha sp. PMI_1271]|nr:hypothetical protein F5882DRAFT_502855 [Hyaloscypha sp. PMI_1271]
MFLRPFALGLLSHLAAIGLLFAGLLIPPSKLTHTQLALSFLPPIWACHIYSWSVGLGALAGVQVLWATELLLFQNPREKFQVIHHQPPPPSPPLKPTGESTSNSNKESEKDDKPKHVRKESYPTDFRSRLQWVFKLHISMRYIGWDTGSPSPSLPIPNNSISRNGRKESRLRWLLNNMLLAGLCFLLIDATNAYQHLDLYFQIETPIDSAFPLPLSALLYRYASGFLPPPRLVRILVLGMQQYAVFTLINRVLAILHVSLGGLGIFGEWWGGVDSWPMLMGSPAVVWGSGLRGFWGRFWHQLFRDLFMSPAKALINVLGVKPKSLPAYGIKIVIAFFISGVLHAASLPRNMYRVSPLRYASFFWIQGVCVLLEVMVEQMLGDRQLKQRAWWKRYGAGIIRLLWTVVVLYVTVPVVADELTRVLRVMGLKPTVLLPMPLLRYSKMDRVFLREIIR